MSETTRSTEGFIRFSGAPGEASTAVVTQRRHLKPSRPTAHGSSGDATAGAGANGAPEDYAGYRDLTPAPCPYPANTSVGYKDTYRDLTPYQRAHLLYLDSLIR